MIAGRVRALVVAGVVALAGTVGCATAPGTTDWNRELADAEARWQAAAVHDYSYGLVRFCYCVAGQTRPVTVTVRGGAFSGIAYSDSVGGAVDTTLFQQYLTMDRYFTLLHQIIQSDPYDFSATYNQSLGFPINVFVNPERMTTGEEFVVEIYAFTANPP